MMDLRVSTICPQFDFDEIMVRRITPGSHVSTSLAFGLGAGLYFECFQRTGSHPSRFFLGHNPRFEQQLVENLQKFIEGDQRAAISTALRMNAMAMNVDRSPVAGIMGMELFAEELENWCGLADWPECAHHAARLIESGGALHRVRYAEFLRNAADWFASMQSLVTSLEEVAAGWAEFGIILGTIARRDTSPDFETAARKLQHLAALEEHFWGQVLDAVDR